MIDIERLIHSFKTAIACLIGIFVTRMLGHDADQWIVISILVLMCSQIYVGTVLQKSYLRFLGTLAGCLIAVLTILTVGPSLLTITIVICVASFIFSYFATGNEDLMYACTLGAITTTLILLSKTPNLDYAVLRFLEISVGIVIATLVSQFLLPIHARTHLRRTQAKTLEQIKELYKVCIATFQADMETLPNRDLDETIVKLLFKQRKLAKEAKRELFGASFDPEHCMRLLQREKEMLRAIDFMHNALLNIRHAETIMLQSPYMQSFNQMIIGTLEILIKTISSNTLQPLYIEPSSTRNLREEFTKYLMQPSYEELIYIDGFIFAAEVLTESLTKTASLYQTLIDEEKLVTMKA